MSGESIKAVVTGDTGFIASVVIRQYIGDIVADDFKSLPRFPDHPVNGLVYFIQTNIVDTYGLLVKSFSFSGLFLKSLCENLMNFFNSELIPKC